LVQVFFLYGYVYGIVGEVVNQLNDNRIISLADSYEIVASFTMTWIILFIGRSRINVCVCDVRSSWNVAMEWPGESGETYKPLDRISNYDFA
jgi:hypothetical protein